MTHNNDAPHLCVQTLAGHVHIIPVEVIEKIISGEMAITDLDDWAIIVRAALAEWLHCRPKG